MTKNEISEQQKVKKLYDLIGQRGLYVNSNFDVFPEAPEQISLAGGAGYQVPLLKAGEKAYTSPLLFATLTSLLNHGTMLVTGAPSVGKTTGAEYVGHFFTGTELEEILASEIQGHPQLTEEKMVASYNIGKLVKDGEEEVRVRRFLKCPVKIIDEGNRMPPDSLSIIQRLVDNGMAVYGGQLLKAAKGPLFVTANYADDGTFQFTPPFLDRFDVAVMVTSPQSWDLQKIRDRGDEKLNGGHDKLLEIPDDLKLNFDEIRKQVKNMPEEFEYDVPKMRSFGDFMYGTLRFSEAASTSLARATKGNAWQVNQDNAQPGHFTDNAFTYTVNELSVRTAKAMPRYAQAFAWLNGDDKVTTNHLKAIAPYLLWHKIMPTTKALAEDPHYANDRIAFVRGLIQKIEGEYDELAGSESLKIYVSALVAIRTGVIGKRQLTPEEVRKAAKNAINRIGNEDKPYAIILASQVATEYNERVMEQNGKQ